MERCTTPELLMNYRWASIQSSMLRIHGMMHHTGVIDKLPLGKHSIQYVENSWNDAPHRFYQFTAVGQGTVIL